MEPDDFQRWQLAFAGQLNQRFESAPAQDILAWALANFGRGLSMSTSFGSSGMVLIDMILKLDPDVDIFYIDTGYFFPETLSLIQRAEACYGRPFRRVTPALSVAEQSMRYGPGLYNRNPEECCRLRKVEPMAKALQDSLAWMAALRRDQSTTRKETPILRWNPTHQVMKISPLARWQEADVWDYLHAHKVPYNGLHDQNYPSVGCWPCTQPVQDEQDLRAGRWTGISKTECGLHWAHGQGI